MNFYPFQTTILLTNLLSSFAPRSGGQSDGLPPIWFLPVSLLLPNLSPQFFLCLVDYSRSRPAKIEKGIFRSETLDDSTFVVVLTPPATFFPLFWSSTSFLFAFGLGGSLRRAVSYPIAFFFLPS